MVARRVSAVLALAVLSVASCSGDKASPQTLSCQLSVGASSARSPVDLEAQVHQSIRVGTWTATFSEIQLAQTQRQGVRVKLSGPGGKTRFTAEGGMPTNNVPFTASFFASKPAVQVRCVPLIRTD